MNAFGMTLLWCALQVTVFGGIAALLYLLVRRLGPASRSTILTSALVSVIVLSLLAWSPWPRWIQEPGEAGASVASGSNAVLSPADAVASELADDAGTPTVVDDGSSTTMLFLQNLWDEMKAAPAPEPAAAVPGWTWQSVVAWLFLAGVGIGVLRFVAGLFAVRRYRRQSHSIDSSEMHELLDIVRAELSCLRPIELRESRTASSPATIGWRRPIILLPHEWRGWSHAERHAVLAHEVAHIRRFDFPAWVVAQLGVVLHFYHPIVHWLAGRLRLEQELAADAAAAGVVGGNSIYLQTLAGMALRQPERRLSWPARTFLPSHHTFLRRIEMLRHRTPLSVRVPIIGRMLLAAGLLSAAVFAAGLRSPFGGPAVADAQETPPLTQVTTVVEGADSSETLSLAWIPRDAVMVFAARPHALLSQPLLASLKKVLVEQKGLEEAFGLNVAEDVEQVAFVFLPRERRPDITEPDDAGIVIHFRKDVDSDKLIGNWLHKPEKAEFSGQTYYKPGRKPGKYCFFPDKRTAVLLEEEEYIRRFVIAGKRGASKADWAESWELVTNQQVGAFVDLERLRTAMNASLETGRGAIAMAPIAPLWQQGRYALYGATAADDLRLSLSIVCSSPEGASQVEETVKAGLVLTRNLLSAMRAQFSRSSDEQAVMALRAMDVADEMIDGVKVETEQNRVNANATIDSEAGEFVAMLVPAIGKAREAARRTMSMNNLKQIALAFHNYHSAHGHFPPAVVMGPDGKTPHSWRVEILPYIDQVKLYDEYRMTEPWDSEHNKKLLERIPPVYLCPQDDPDSTNASYFGLVGKGTIFENKEGAKIQEIVDGTSNTLMVVESKKAVPWTKPEDISFDPTKDVPKLGGFYKGGFIAALCDGSVRFFSETIDANVLKILIQRNDGQPLPEF